MHSQPPRPLPLVHRRERSNGDAGEGRKDERPTTEVTGRAPEQPTVTKPRERGDTATMRRRPQEGCTHATATLQKQALHGALVRRRLQLSEARDAEDEEQRP